MDPAPFYFKRDCLIALCYIDDLLIKRGHGQIISNTKKTVDKNSHFNELWKSDAVFVSQNELIGSLDNVLHIRKPRECITRKYCDGKRARFQESIERIHGLQRQKSYR